jgi:hypothetical protein
MTKADILDSPMHVGLRRAQKRCAGASGDEPIFLETPHKGRMNESSTNTTKSQNWRRVNALCHGQELTARASEDNLPKREVGSGGNKRSRTNVYTDMGAFFALSPGRRYN